ncbi:tetracycline efflux MFS transporter TetA(P) [Ktedonobacteria bacterium brp13]|nr:tetracycline efflux MFS transporter TetA(P) [Ktedonobacteria bacterium brp13]
MHNRGASSIYILLSGVSSLCYSMIFSIELIYQVMIVGLDPLQMMLIGSVQQFVNLLFQAPTGILADMYSRRWAVVSGLFLIGTGYLTEGYLPIFMAMLAAAGIAGLGATLANGADSAWIADEVGVERVGQVYIRSAQIGSIASLLGIGISAVLVNMSLNLPIVLGGGLFISLSIVLALVMPERHFKPMQREGRSTFQQMSHTLRASVNLVRMRSVLLTILGICVFYGMFTASFDRLWPYYLLHDFTLPSLGGLKPVVWFCLIEAGIVVTNWIGIEVVRRSVDTNSHYSVVWTMLMVDSIMIVSVIGFALAEQFVVALVVFLLFTTAAGPRASLEQAWLNQNLNSNVRATLLSLKGQVNAIAQIIGGPLLGIVAIVFTTRAALITVGVILSPVLLLYVRTLRHDKPRATSIKGDG